MGENISVHFSICKSDDPPGSSRLPVDTPLQVELVAIPLWQYDLFLSADLVLAGISSVSLLLRAGVETTTCGSPPVGLLGT